MFVSILISFYGFLIGPGGKGPSQVVDPATLLIQEVFISGLPSVVLAGFTFTMGYSYGNMLAGIMLIAAGVVMIIGMIVASSLVPNIAHQYVVGGVDSVPYIFIAAGIGIMAVGGFLITRSRKKFQRTSNLDDLR
jgi:hypothetical protein